MATLTKEEIREAVRENYGNIAQTESSGCCDPGCCSTETKEKDPAQTARALGYTDSEINTVPAGANMGLGCGNPGAIAALQPGERVLDLGSGGGFDCFLAAKAVGDSGRVIGVDMTAEMVSKARGNAEQGGYGNVEFRLGEIEHLPIADNSVDVIISNCVINLSPDKGQVFKEAFRVLDKGGRLAISDVVASTELPEHIRKDLALYTGCVAGASQIAAIKEMLKDAGFSNIQIAPKDESRSFIKEWVPNGNVEDYIVSATIEAVKK